MSRSEAGGIFAEAMRLAVRRHMIADVPVGAFLSGGIDSGVIVALMAEATSSPIHTFTVSFPEFDQTDARRAAQTAHAVGTVHHEIECRGADMAMLPDIMWSLDEPIGDAIVLPMYVLAREARKQVTCVLSGEGADEILGGYAFHRRLCQIAALRRLIPGFAWRSAAAISRVVPPALLDLLIDYPGSLGEEGRRKISVLLSRVAGARLEDLYRDAISLFDPEDIVAMAELDELRAHARRAPSPLLGRHRNATYSTLGRLVDAQFPDWLPDDILMKADKMAMAHSLEGRIPFMDEAVINAAAIIPDEYKLTVGTNKRVLRDLGRDILPESIVNSPKTAFYAPMEVMAAAPEVRDMLARTLDPQRLRRRGLFAPAQIASLPQQTSKGGFLVGKRLFALAALELWFERFAPDACFAETTREFVA